MQYKLGLSVEQFEQNKEKIEQMGLPFERIEDPRARVVALARQQLGKPYKYGASVLRDAPNSFDCSSLTSWLYVQAGIALPRISVDQYVFSEEILSGNALPGDLVFSNTHRSIRNVFRDESVEYKPGTKVPRPIDHCGIFMGEMVIHATESKGEVVEEPLKESEYFQDIVGFRRISNLDYPRFVISVPDGRVDIRNKGSFITENGQLFAIKPMKG